MIRPFTVMCALMAFGAGLYLYQQKHRAELQDREIQRILTLADAARQRAGVLRAEYALLNDPSRLSDLAQTHLPTLRATDPKLFVTLADLDRRLPPVAPPPADAPDPQADPVDTQTHPPGTFPVAEAPAPLPHDAPQVIPTRTTQVATRTEPPAAEPQPAAAAARVAAVVPRRPAKPRAVMVAAARPARDPYELQAAAPVLGAPVLGAPVLGAPVLAATRLRADPVAAPMPMVGSALGMARALSPAMAPAGAAFAPVAR